VGVKEIEILATVALEFTPATDGVYIMADESALKPHPTVPSELSFNIQTS